MDVRIGQCTRLTYEQRANSEGQLEHQDPLTLAKPEYEELADRYRQVGIQLLSGSEVGGQRIAVAMRVWRY